MQQQSGRECVVVIQAERLGVLKRSTSLRDRNRKSIRIAEWNRELRKRECDVRFLIAIASPSRPWTIETVILATGDGLCREFGVPKTPTTKYQLNISARWIAERVKKMIYVWFLTGHWYRIGTRYHKSEEGKS